MELITACLDYIPLLPHTFQRRIKFINNPNPVSMHPILIEFDTRRLALDIEVSGEGIEINTTEGSKNNSLAKTSFHTLRVHPITNYRMDVEEYGTDGIPDAWEITGKERFSRRVPREYFAAYNLAYDLTSSVGVFGRAIQSNDYQMRGNNAAYSAIGIFSVQTEAQTPFTSCFCAMPRWYRIAEYNWFAFAWNDLVQHVGNIVNDLHSADRMPRNHLLSDWVILSLLRIHICIAMNYAPFIVTEAEKTQISNRIQNDPYTPWGPNDNLLAPIQNFVKQGLFSLMTQIQSDSQKSVLTKHRRAFRTWVQYGLPMLSSSAYVSNTLGKWIVEQWIGLLRNDEQMPCFDVSVCRKRCNIVINDKYGIIEKTEETDAILTPACHNCYYSRLWLINTMIFPSDQQILDQNKHNALFFLQEYVKQGQLLNSLMNGALDRKLSNIFSAFPNADNETVADTAK